MDSLRSATSTVGASECTHLLSATVRPQSCEARTELACSERARAAEGERGKNMRVCPSVSERVRPSVCERSKRMGSEEPAADVAVSAAARRFQDKLIARALYKSFDRWFYETGLGKPLWSHHGHVHRRRQAFGWWKTWRHRRNLLTWYFATRHFNRWKQRHAALRGERLDMLATRHVIKACYAKWNRFRGQVRAQRAARDLIRGEEQQSPSAKKSPSKRKKKKGKRAAVGDLPSIEEDGVATVVHNLADLKSIEPEEESSSSACVDGADSSVATALTCVVCFHGASEHAIVPCGHRCLCETCSTKFQHADALCPVCRGPVQFTLKIFG